MNIEPKVHKLIHLYYSEIYIGDYQIRTKYHASLEKYLLYTLN